MPWLAGAVLLPIAQRRAGTRDAALSDALEGVAAGSCTVGAAIADAAAPRRDAGVVVDDGRCRSRRLWQY